MFLVSRAIAQKFTNLLDTFSSYTGKALQHIRVKSTEDGLEAFTFALAFLNLTDTFTSYTGKALQYLRVNAGETGLETAILDAATKALSNLASVAINASLLFDTDNAYDVGSAVKNLRNVYSKLITTPAVVFPATQVPSANANTLDDYEEGDWTAAFSCGTSGTITISDTFKTGSYVKIGRMVTVTGLFRIASVSSPVGSLLLTGLPFVCGTGDKFYSGVSIDANGLVNTATTSIVGYVEAGQSRMWIAKWAAGSEATLAGDVQANSSFIIQATYFTD